ncbi:MAG: TolC family protein, partial [Cyanobacteria bacterium J06641_5]
MRAYRFFFGVSAGAAIALLAVTTATAQHNVATPEPSDLPASEATTSEPPRLGVSEQGETSEVTETEIPGATTSQPTPPTPAIPLETGAEDLQRDRNPSPLFFPTQSQEVRVEEVTPISLDRALEIARRNSSDLREARLILTRSAFALREQLAAEFPTLDLNTTVQRFSSASTNISEALGGGVGSPFFPNPQTNINVSLALTYNLFTGGQRPASIRLAEEQIERDRLQVEVVDEQLRLDVFTAYYEVQRADSQVEIANAAIADAEQSLRDAQLLEEAGLG